MNELDVLGSYWTLSGPVQIAVPGGREWSVFDWPTRCAQAKRVGLRGLGIWHADLEHQLQTHSLGEIRQ
ncbi:MAG: hypothetical protein J2P15_23245, partial [Micromonosporaceae bacterium]|nr:hypothetical protein [Micromonosporaceae bacterium]